ncbi:MAG TPA: acyl-CoA dehydrogenase family protein [Acidimicrobiia bacterium]|nr:acyl-CoA dehydrogenase family protein [Acidimicrobiia bacterium]
MQYTPEQEAFRDEVRAWLDANLTDEFRALGGDAGPADDRDWDQRLVWERKLGAGGWIGLGWPAEAGGRGASVVEQVIFNEEYAKAGAPARLSFFGEGLLGPTIAHLGTQEQKQRFLPPIQRAEEFWCQGYSEPDAGSDLAAVKTTAVLDGDEWVINGQKIWTTYAHHADWCFAVVRTDLEAPKHKSLSYLLVPMDQPGVEVRGIRSIVGTSEFNEVFFTDARTAAANVVGDVNDGWKVAMATLGFERGTAFLGQQLRFEEEVRHLIAEAQKRNRTDESVMRQRLADAYARLRIMRFNGERMLANLAIKGVLGPESSIGKLYWSTWHRNLGELEIEVLGADGMLVGAGYEPDEFQHMFLSSRAETIYAGSSEIQRNVIGERVLGLPREPAPASA